MKIPFVENVESFEPRKHLGQDESLTTFQKDVLAALDVLDQRSSASLSLAVKAWNGLLMVAGVLLLTLIINLPLGAMVIKMFKTWLEP